MATHLAAFQQSVDSATLIAINNVVDDVLTRTSVTRFLIPPVYNAVRWAAASGINLTRAQIVTPSLLVRRMNPEVVPRRRGAEQFSLSGSEIFIPTRPLILVAGEEIEFDTAEDGAGATQMNGFVALGPAALPPVPDGDIRIVRATGTTTLVARAWTSVVLTLDSSLEAGVYALAGFVAISAGAIAARAIITGQPNRPGVIAFNGAEGPAVDFDAALWNQTIYYDMGHFTHITVPAIQFFSSSADVAETVYLYVVRIAAP